MDAESINKTKTDHHVVIVGGGFGGLNAAKSLKDSRIRVTLIDKRNFHLFQPLLYQVATGDLSLANIVAPLRSVLKKQKNVKVVLGEVTGIDPKSSKVIMNGDEISYDSLILAPGSGNNFFGNDRWEPFAPGLKTIEDAFEIRNRIITAFEVAEKETDPVIKKEHLSFVVIGGGSTGVELAGAIAEVAGDTLRQEYRTIQRGDAAITLIEGRNHILPAFPEDLSVKAEKSLTRLGIKVVTNAQVIEINQKGVTYIIGDRTEFLPSRTIIWAAGVKASGLGKVIADSTGAELDRMGRVIVQPDCSVPGFENIFIVGDLAHFHGENGNPLPGLAPVAMQQGRYVARLIQSRLKGKTMPGFRYINRGTMSILGRNSGVAIIEGLKFHGWFAWFLWLSIHLVMIIQFGNRMLILMQWGWKYISKSHYARVLTNVRSCIEDAPQ